jgi:transketolase
VEAWKAAIERRNGPTALILTRQNLPILDRNKLASASGLKQGAYILWEKTANPDVIIIGTGSEVHIALEAGKLLDEKGVSARIVSMPSWEMFDAQPENYRNSILPPSIRARISVEAGTTLGWERYIGLDGIAIGVDRFGASAPMKEVYKNLGLTAQHVVNESLKLLGEKKR